LALLPKIFAHADKNVRAEGTGLALALHAYLGPALDPHLSELKPVQVKELGEAFAKADEGEEGFGKLKQSRFTKSQQLERERKAAVAAAAAAQPPRDVAEDGAGV
jgi:cytoskeleton-associated protein 5